MRKIPMVIYLCMAGIACLLLTNKLISSDTVSSEVKEITINMINTKGDAIGTAKLTQQGDAVHVHLEAKNLPPGEHGIHFHENGVCEKPDFKSAGAHLNPGHKQHGFDNPKGFHAGDLPNINVKDDGTVTASFESKSVSLKDGADNSLLKSGGTALIIHEKKDDYFTDPSGNSGDRIACGVIGKQEK